jgi:hypothetical protein
MPRGPCSFKQRDVARALRAARAAGFEVARVEIDNDGKIIVVTKKHQEEPAGQDRGENEWDKVT